MAWHSDLLGILGNAFKIGQATLSAAGISSPQTYTLPSSSGTLATLEKVGVSIATTPPQSPSAGKLWFDSETGRLLVYYDDQWLVLSASSVVGHSLYYGDSLPSDAQGINGDFYLFVPGGILFGPKTAGSWNAVESTSSTTLLLTSFRTHSNTADVESPYRLGVKVKILKECYLKSWMRWKCTGDTTSAVGYVTLDGSSNILASAPFTNETANGWQTSDVLTTPLLLEANKTYHFWFYGWGVWASGGFPSNPVFDWVISTWDSGGTASTPPTATWDAGSYFLDLNVDVPEYNGVVLRAFQALPKFGTTGQVLEKKSNNSYETQWTTLHTAAPTISDPTNNLVELSCATPDAQIYYTTTTDKPTFKSDLYTAPIDVSAVPCVQAIAIAPGCALSSISTKDFVE